MIDLTVVLLYAAAVVGAARWWAARRSRLRRRTMDASTRADLVNRRADRSAEVRAPRQL